ncbi:acetyl-CoA C-acetyltransferase [soil metagenome]
MRGAFIVGYARTPIGRLLGGLSAVTAMDLGGVAIRAALDRAGVPPDRVDQVVMGHVLQAGQGQITARQAARAAGIGMATPAVTVNKVCLSGSTAVHLADLAIRAGEHEVVVAGGMESMSRAPHLLPRARSGYRTGDGVLVDAMLDDGLRDPFDDAHMGAVADRTNERHGISRARQDEWAAMSHERAASAWKDGRFPAETVPVRVPGPGGDILVVDADEGIRPGVTPESLSRLRPAFTPAGTVTAGNASQVSDGAAAMVLAGSRAVARMGLTPLGRVLSFATVAGPDNTLHHQPAEACRRAAARIDVPPDGLDLYEINEAFAAVAIRSADLLGVGADRVNVNGGAVALGHPIGCSGTRVTVTLLAELRRRGGGRGAAALCGGGGQGDALIVEAL